MESSKSLVKNDDRFFSKVIKSLKRFFKIGNIIENTTIGRKLLFELVNKKLEVTNINYKSKLELMGIAEEENQNLVVKINSLEQEQERLESMFINLDNLF